MQVQIYIISQLLTMGPRRDTFHFLSGFLASESRSYEKSVISTERAEVAGKGRKFRKRWTWQLCYPMLTRTRVLSTNAKIDVVHRLSFLSKTVFYKPQVCGLWNQFQEQRYYSVFVNTSDFRVVLCSQENWVDYVDFPYALCTHTYIASPIINIHPPEWYFCYNLWIYITKTPVYLMAHSWFHMVYIKIHKGYIMVHSWSFTFHGLGQIYKHAYSSLCYTQCFHYCKSSLCSRIIL